MQKKNNHKRKTNQICTN